MRGQLAVIRFIDASGRPIDPGFGNPGGSGNRPDQGFNPDYPDQGLPGGEYPDQGLPPGRFPGRPSHPIARPPWETEVWPPGPTDPGWGVDSPEPGVPTPPIFLPVGPDQGLPPVAGHLPSPPTDPPPGTIWPPLPPGAPAGKTALLVWLVGVGWRYMVVTIPVAPDQGLPAEGDNQAQPKGRYR